MIKARESMAHSIRSLPFSIVPCDNTLTPDCSNVAIFLLQSIKHIYIY